MNTLPTQSTLAVGLSGGVDSATCAMLLKEQQHQVHAIFMRNWHDEDNYCTTYQDEADAYRVCEQLNIPLEVIDFSERYREKVFASMLQCLEAGHTPNPDLLCNEHIKFGCLLEHVQAKGIPYLATGHYAQSMHSPSGGRLFQGCDQTKDQSYFLARVHSAALNRAVFPLGQLNKSDVRELAAARGLEVARKKDSTGICFVGKRPFSEFIGQHLLDKPGPILSDTGLVLGEHRGLFHHTIGQRKGLAIGGVKHAQEAPWWVVEKKTESQSLIVTQNPKHPALYNKHLLADSAFWTHKAPNPHITLAARIRHQQSLQECRITKDEHHTLTVEFKEVQRAITPGQYIVFYDKGSKECFGSARIRGAINSESAA